MSTPPEDPDRAALRRRLQAHTLPWLVCRWAWVGIRLLWSAIRASFVLLRQERFSEDRKRERNAERLDRIRNPHLYRGRK
jgi:hypothetical protein